MKIVYDLTGKRFGRLIAIKNITGISKSGRKIYYWLCQCDCGNTRLVPTKNLKNGHTQSCGCLHKEKIAEMGRKNIVHGDAKAEIKGLYLTWMGMKNRCYYPKHISYKYYGERGIIVFPPWKKSYKTFKKWALSNGYKNGLTIDRIDPKGNYEPNNCQFLTKSQNSRKCRLQFYGIYECF